MIVTYAQAHFYRGLRSNRVTKEIEATRISDLSFAGLSVEIVEMLDRKDYLFDPLTPTERRVSNQEYVMLRASLLQALEGSGVLLPSSSPSETVLNPDQARKFDSVVAKGLYQNLQMTLYEASKPEIWNYLTARILPDLAITRFGREKTSDRAFASRFLGSERNTFRRLHIRAKAVEGDFKILDMLKEDNLVAILERPSLIKDEEFTEILIRFVAEKLLPQLPPSAREDGVRDFAKRLLRELAAKRLDRLDEDQARIELEGIGNLTIAYFSKALNN